MVDMFEGSVVQFLCILESLTDINRRIFLIVFFVFDFEVEILDVYVELFMAGQEILVGLFIYIDFFIKLYYYLSIMLYFLNIFKRFFFLDLLQEIMVFVGY